MSKSYRVQWEIDIFEAGSPRDAARQAWEMMRAEGSTATVFDVFETDGNGVAIRVDLSEDCTCGRGAGKHHPDCPAWDSSVDNYDDEVDDSPTSGVIEPGPRRGIVVRGFAMEIENAGPVEWRVQDGRITLRTITETNIMRIWDGNPIYGHAEGELIGGATFSLPIWDGKASGGGTFERGE